MTVIRAGVPVAVIRAEVPVVLSVDRRQYFRQSGAGPRMSASLPRTGAAEVPVMADTRIVVRMEKTLERIVVLLGCLVWVCCGTLGQLDVSLI